MKPTKRSLSRLSIVAVVFLSLIGLGVMMTGEPASKHANGKPTPEKHHVGLVEDWSTHHLVFSNPGTYEQAVAKGTYAKWLDLRYNSRFIMQQARRKADAVSASGSSASTIPPIKLIGEPTPFRGTDALRGWRTPRPTLKKDWSAAMLTGAVLPNTFPAKYNFSTTGTPSCTTDFVVYPTGSTGSATAATIIAYNNLYGTTCSGTVPSVYWAYNTGGTTGAVTTSPIISGDGTQVTFIQVSSGGVASLVLVKWQQTPVQHTATGNITSGSTAVTITSGGSFSAADAGAVITGSLSGIPAGDTIASVTDSTHATLANAATTTRTGITLTIHAEAVGTPGVPPTAASASAYRSCTAPCMYSVALNGSPNDTYSAPFYDYAVDDALYVGDNSGYLEKFTGVFNGAISGPTTVQLNTAPYAITSPVYDPVSGCVFVGDTRGYLYKVNSGVAGSVCASTTFSTNVTSAILGNGTANQGILDAPLVDSTAARVYVFIAGSKAITATGTCAATNNCVAEFTTGFASAAAPSIVEPLGTGGANYSLYAGAFDNLYYSSSNPASPSGNIYVVGNTGATNGTGTLYRVPIVNNVLQAPVPISTSLNGNQNVWGSPVTEFCNNGASACGVNGTDTKTTSGTDYIFLSVFRGVVGINCTNRHGNGCVIAYNVSDPTTTLPTPSTLNVTATGNPGCWVTGGFIIDNASSSTGASQVYFVNLNGNSPSAAPSTTCTTPGSGNTIQAVQASQSGLN